MKKNILKKILVLTIYLFVACDAFAVSRITTKQPEPTPASEAPSTPASEVPPTPANEVPSAPQEEQAKPAESASNLSTDNATDDMSKPIDQYGNGFNSYDSPQQNSDGATLEDNVNPLYWKQVRENYLKKRKYTDTSNKTEQAKKKSEAEIRQELKKQKELSDIKKKNEKNAKVVDKGPQILLKKRPSDSYRTAIASDLISKKIYDKANLHLPQVVYEDDYKKLLFQAILNQDLDTMRAIIERFKTTEVRDENGNTPLLFAVMSGKVVPAKILIGMGSAVNVTNNEGFSPVYIATKDKNASLASLLIKAGGNARIKTQNSKTTLMTAAENNDTKMVNKLISIGLEANARMDDGNTALHLAAMKNSSLAADLLISNDADYDLQNSSGFTPLMLASAYGSTETVSLLIQSGADITVKDSYGQDAYAIAKNNRHNIIMAMLTSASFRASQNNRSFDSGLETSAVNDVKYEQPFVTPDYRDKSPIQMPRPMFTDEEKSQM